MFAACCFDANFGSEDARRSSNDAVSTFEASSMDLFNFFEL
jgi:hypothetical protein